MIANFRDLGGLIGHEGKEVKKGQIYRSAQLSDLSKDEINQLEELTIHTIVDFRNDREREATPDTQIPSVTYISLDILDKDSAISPDITTMMSNIDQGKKLMGDVYTSLVTSKDAQEGYRRFLDLLLTEGDIPLVFHCTFGKDRTGYGAALILRILGVSDRDILVNYVESNQALKTFNETLLNQLKDAYHLTELQLKQIAPLLDVDPCYLNRAFQLIDDKYTSFDSYLEEALHFDQTKIAAFREKFLVDIE